MTDFQPSIPTSFEPLVGTEVSFNRAEYEYSEDQDHYVPSVKLVFGDYEYDQLGTADAPVGNKVIALRFIAYNEDPSDVDAEVLSLEAMTGKLGKLWATDMNGDRRFTWGRFVKRPGLRWSAGDIFKKAIELPFRGQSEWQAEDPTVITEAIDETPHTFTATNPSLRTIKNAVLLLRGTWTGPVGIQNETNGYGFTYDVDGVDSGSSADDMVRFDSGAHRVDRSYDGGATWQNALEFVTFTKNAGQIQQMILDSGDNDFEVTDGDTPDATLSITFYE